ncbi:bioflm peroxide resistance protein BsmA [Brenneria alni]|uniref:Bioflm peroxide resistance protein BsmA n=1 Tax=Brenneria alni TaxID=71656 RepID=A0A421DK03_9GAMM|nr:biofilm peroxide resistance protein BsmA [Brenneria alni]RLM19055.1 bioflm peroxide resistance protein BsmA [Brenneria alni]
MNRLRFLLLPLFMLMLCACQVLQGNPAPLPAPTDQAQLITYSQTATLEKIGTVSVTVRGSPDDADRAIQRKADEKGARYYTIVMKSETTHYGMWTSRAVLYR